MRLTQQITVFALMRVFLAQQIIVFALMRVFLAQQITVFALMRVFLAQQIIFFVLPISQKASLIPSKTKGAIHLFLQFSRRHPFWPLYLVVSC